MTTFEQLDPDPLKEFDLWYKEAQKLPSITYPDAACVSTIDPEGFPEGRIVLVREVSKKGFVFYTNSNSTKGLSLATTPKAALTYYWDPLGRQIRVQGTITTVPDSQTDNYFKGRPRMSCIGAWASLQSEGLKNRQELVNRVRYYEEEFEGKPVPRPPHWKGYCLKPHKIEFWLNGDFRLHDRFQYLQSPQGNWTQTRLYP